ncbi:hypothetical protein [Bradyrhizobium iriomotense]|uniref:Uncharacterized protein n=1 Tax=Bradyrhizobium iriomotense TaxID=441950 RepID=A0ABQ6BGJ0_9BRAD|nr:hypothetical protein [Bradyrhizobium iriomotense]GLR91307.1 hypothetical protein GCM10007857_80240 [Bradyrhizobium iriomotense]
MSAVFAKFALLPGTLISERSQAALLSADIIEIEINALNHSIRDFAPAALAFVFNNADRIFGIVDCCNKNLDYWETLLDKMTISERGGCRWTVRLLASEPSGWEDRIQFHGPKGPFELVSPNYVEDGANA